MSDVLRAVKDSECQPCQEVPWSQITGDGPQAEPSFSFQKDIYILQLWDVVFSVSAILDELWPIFQVLAAGVQDV